MRKRIIWGLVAMALSSGVAWGEDLHREAATCRLSAALSTECLNNCRQCHESSDPSIPLDIYVQGDEQLCKKCHPQQTTQETGTLLLRYVRGGGGNHPVAILYSPEEARSVLIPTPVGPKLFTNKEGNNPKIHCSTCHDAMSSSHHLLRVNNSGSALCLSCHLK